MTRRPRLSMLFAALGLAAALTAARAQPPRPEPPPPRPGNVALEELLEQAAAATGRIFLVDRATPESVFVSGVDTADIDYTALLAVLRNNDLAAVEIDGYVHIVRAAEIRQYPLPIVDVDDDVPADEWVSAVIDMEGMQATQLVPVLRPLLPVEAHLAATQAQNKLIVVDRFGNVRRIAALIDGLR